MKSNLLFLTVMAFLLTSCATTPGLKENNPIEKVYNNSIQLRNKTIPLPAGEWKVIGRATYGDNDAYFRIVLLKVTESKEMEASIIITTDTWQNEYIGYNRYKPCDRTDILHVEVKNNSRGGAQDCWAINHFKTSVNPKNPAIKEAFKYLVSNKISMPTIMITTYHRFTGKHTKSKMMNMLYYVNPEAEGFDAPTMADWSTSDWHLLQINKYPKKVEYIERLKKEGAIMHEKIREGFGE